MKKIRLFFTGLAIIPALSLVVAQAMPAPKAYACQETFVGFPAWYRGVLKDDCTLKDVGNKGTISLQTFVTIVALNIVQFILTLVGYATVVMLIIGGFNYMTSQGEANKMASAKTTITNAIIGLVISILSVGIVQFIAGSL